MRRRLICPPVLEQAVSGLTPVETMPVHRTLGTARDEFVVSENFDDPLPDDILSEFEK